MYISRRSICIIHVIRIRLKRYLWLKNCFVRINYYRGCFWEYYWNECCKGVSHWICRYMDLLLSQEQNYCCSFQLWTQSPNFSLVIVWLRLWRNHCKGHVWRFYVSSHAECREKLLQKHLNINRQIITLVWFTKLRKLFLTFLFGGSWM